MKPPETVTLIDLEGKPIPLRENVPIHYFNGEYAHIVDFTWQFKDKDYRIYIGSSLKIGEATKHYDSLLPLILFLNDQLTFIRNGMWETLAIYQTTIGRYWEVPWYELTVEQSSLFRHRYQMIQNHRNYYKTTKKGIIRFQPFCESFLKHYPAVFSKLTPYEGESTDA